MNNMATCGKCTATGVTVAHVRACYSGVALFTNEKPAERFNERLAAEKARVSKILHGDKPSTQRSTYYATPYETRGDATAGTHSTYELERDEVEVTGLPGVRVPAPQVSPWAEVDRLRGEVAQHLHYEARGAKIGHFAVYIDGDLKFLRIKVGRYAGRVFVDSMGSDTGYPVRRPDTLETYLAAVLVDPVAAAKRYADELDSCSDCGRPLTNELSRQRGIGPDCWAKR